MTFLARLRKLRHILLSKSDLLYVLVTVMVLRHFYISGKNSSSVNTREMNNLTSQSRSYNLYEKMFVRKAKEISQGNKTVLLCVVNDAYLRIAYNWLCNTKYMGVHDSVLLITTDPSSQNKLKKDWPSLNIVNVDFDIPQDNQFYSHVGYLKIMILRTKIIVSVLTAGIDIMLLEFDFIWFRNPVPHLKSLSKYDMVLQPVSNAVGKLVCGGFMFIFTRQKSIQVFKELERKMTELEEELQNKTNSKSISMRDNDQEYLSSLVNKRYAGVSVFYLSNEQFADGRWYRLGEEERKATQPLVVHNNFVIGNKNKIKRARQWNHWFVRNDGSCDTDLVNKTVHY